MPKDEVFKYITNKDTNYSTEINGVEEFAEFMEKNGFINKNLKDIKDVMWNEAKNKN